MASIDSPSTSTRVAVITVSYGSDAVLPAFLESIGRAARERPLIVVADNSPDEGSIVQALTESAGGTYLPLPSNLGYGGAVNEAIAALPPSVKWVLVSNPDVVLSTYALDELVYAADALPDAGAIGPAIHNADGALYPSARSVPSLRTGLGHALFANLWASNPWSAAYRLDAQQVPSTRTAGWLSGACFLVRRVAFDSIDGFDPRFFMYFEDVDLGWRLGKAGWTNVYEPRIAVVHTGAHSTDRDSASMIRAHHESARVFLDQKYAGPVFFPIRCALRVSLAVRSGFIRRRIRVRARR